jgi:hypothetical protein
MIKSSADTILTYSTSEEKRFHHGETEITGKNSLSFFIFSVLSVSP